MGKVKVSKPPQTIFFEIIRRKLGGPESYIETIRCEEDEQLAFKRTKQFGFYFVAAGHVVVEVRREDRWFVMRICGPGDMIGFGSWLYPDNMSSYRIRTLEKSVVEFMSYSRYLELRSRLPEFNDLVTKALCDIILLKDRRISALENNSVQARVAGLLLSLVEKFGINTPEGKLIDLKVDRLTLAALAGTSGESLARCLTGFEVDGLIFRRRRRVVVRDIRKLAAKS